MVRELVSRTNPTCPLLSLSVQTGLISLRRVHSLKAYVRVRKHDGIAIDDPRHTNKVRRDRTSASGRGNRDREEEEVRQIGS